MNNGSEFEQHEMVVTQKYPSGAQEFFCPTCGRRFVLQWPPAYKRIVLDPGNENALHSGGTAGITINVSSVTARPEEGETSDQTGQLNDPYLSLWSKYLEDNIEL